MQLQAGENRQLARDAPDALYQGKSELQQAVIKAGSESKVLERIRALARLSTNWRAIGIPVRLDDATIKRLAPPAPAMSPAAAAVEANRGKATGRRTTDGLRSVFIHATRRAGALLSGVLLSSEDEIGARLAAFEYIKRDGAEQNRWARPQRSSRSAS